MKNTFPYFVIILFLSCVEKHYAQSLNPAAKEVYDKIIYVEKEFQNFKDGKPANFDPINELVELTKIAPKSWSGDYFGSHFIPEENDIILWKEWFEKNKAFISYYENEDVNKYYFSNKKEQIIRFEYEMGKFRYSYSQPEMERILEITEHIKKDQLVKKKN